MFSKFLPKLNIENKYIIKSANKQNKYFTQEQF